MKKSISALLVLVMMLALLSGCGDNSGGVNVDTSDLYKQVMARFDGKLEEGAVIKVLENDTAVELGYVDQLIEAFNEAYRDKGICAERMNIDQYSDLATDGPYGYGPDVWYQANDILMKYADNQHLLPLPIYEMECYEQIPQSAWNAYATDMNGETFYCGIPLNVQSGMLYYIESMLPDNWETEWDVNSNGTPDFFETYTALYAYSDRGLISIMPAITEIGQLWTPAESFLIDLSTDPYRAERGEERLYDTDEKIQAGLERLVSQIRDAIETLA